MLLPKKIPNTVNARPEITLNKVYTKKPAYFPSCKSKTFSTAKVEKVVKAPQNPIRKK